MAAPPTPVNLDRLIAQFPKYKVRERKRDGKWGTGVGGGAKSCLFYSMVSGVTGVTQITAMYCCCSLLPHCCSYVTHSMIQPAASKYSSDLYEVLRTHRDSSTVIRVQSCTSHKV